MQQKELIDKPAHQIGLKYSNRKKNQFQILTHRKNGHPELGRAVDKPDGKIT